MGSNKKESELLPPSRVVINFLEKCNMACPYCYCPFNGKRTDFSILHSVLSILSSWHVRILTYGGGDPFYYKEFSEVLLQTRKIVSTISLLQVDTNGIGISSKEYDSIANSVDMLGLPLDGPTPSIHARLRGRKEHFNQICLLMRDMQKIGVPIKINTIVSKFNIASLPDMAEIIQRYSARVWSLYEIWPIQGTRSYAYTKQRIPHNHFSDLVLEIRNMVPSVEVEAGTVSARRCGYFFTSQSGDAYTIDQNDPNRYLPLGSVFSRDVLRNWHASANTNGNVAERIDRRISVMRHI